jgi:hypothetical protein
MDRQQRMDRIGELTRELRQHLHELDVLDGSGGECGGPRSETVDVHFEPERGESIPLDYGGASDGVIARFMTMVTPLAVPGEFGPARSLFEQLASEAEYVGRRQSGGHLWAVRLGVNGRYELWTDSQGVVESIDYRGS